MSHSSGIEVSEALKGVMSNAIGSKEVRLIKITIEGESLEHKATVNTLGSWEADMDAAISGNIDGNSGCYLLYRLDSENSNGSEWIFICYVPDKAAVRSKMLYSSTKATLKKEFGSHHIKDELFGTLLSDINLDGYKKHLQSEAAPAPLSMAEVEKAEIKSAEVGVDVGASTKRTLVRGVAFPLSAAAQQQLAALKSGAVTYVQLSIDMKAETVELECADSTDLDGIVSKTPADHPRYHFANYAHSHEGEAQTAIVFIYSCPGYQCKVKERMLYSSCKDGVLEVAESDVGIELAKKLEVGENNEISKEFVHDALHPKKEEAKKQFSRPTRPGAGARRLVR